MTTILAILAIHFGIGIIGMIYFLWGLKKYDGEVTIFGIFISLLLMFLGIFGVGLCIKTFHPDLVDKILNTKIF